jgi:ferric-dicitrate binding protein FerR (iron transport regulator)
MDRLNKWLHDDSFLCWRFFQTEKDQLFWENFIKENPETKRDIDEAIHVLNSVRLNDFRLSMKDKLQMYAQIRKHIEKKRRYKRIRLSIAVSAAAACLALFVVLSDRSFSRPSMAEDTATSATADTAFVNEKDIRLLTADNQIMSFDEDADIQYDAKGSVVVSAGNKQVVSREVVSREMETEEIRLNKLIVPYGKHSSLTLEDGTKVWVNSGSTLEFPTVFQPGKREIQVDGEIYIEVAKKTDQPFYVNTARMSVEVSGTRFNVSAYREDSEHSVVLVEGSVEVNVGKEKIHLIPDQMLSVTENHLSRKKVNVYDHISWKDGLLQFSSEPLSLILTRLSRYYDIPVTCEKEIENIRCTGKLVLFDDIRDVLQTIRNTIHVTYTMDESKIHLQK